MATCMIAETEDGRCYCSTREINVQFSCRIKIYFRKTHKVYILLCLLINTVKHFFLGSILLLTESNNDFVIPLTRYSNQQIATKYKIALIRSVGQFISESCSFRHFEKKWITGTANEKEYFTSQTEGGKPVEELFKRVSEPLDSPARLDTPQT